MSKRVEYVTSRECDIIEGAGAWCVIESTPDADIAISQHETEQEACAAWSAAKGWHNVSEQERKAMQKKIIDTLLKRV